MIPDELRRILLSPIRPGRVGKDGKGFSHVEAYEIRAHLIRLFDFDGWDSEVLDMQEVFETSELRRKKNKQGEEYGEPFMAWTVCYRARVKLTVCWPIPEDGYGSRSTFSEWASGTAENQPSRADAHDLAMKTAESQALKRCAMNLGDQYGLSLYKKGSTDALVRQTWHSAAKASASPSSVDEHVTESVPESERVEEPGLPRNANGSISHSRITDEEREAAGLMSKEQSREHAKLANVKDPKKAERRSAADGPDLDDRWTDQPAGHLELPTPESVAWCERWSTELADCVTPEMVRIAMDSARGARRDNIILAPQLSALVGEGTSKLRELTEQNQGAESSVAS